MKKLIFSFVALCIFGIYACSDDGHGGSSNSDYIAAADCTGNSPTYTNDIATILDTKCALSGCHAGSSAAHGLNLSGYNNAKNNFDAHSILCAINHGSGCDPMPSAGAKLSNAEILTITCWAKNSFPQ